MGRAKLALRFGRLIKKGANVFTRRSTYSSPSNFGRAASNSTPSTQLATRVVNRGSRHFSSGGLRQRNTGTTRQQHRSTGSFERQTYRAFGGRNPVKRYKFGKKSAVLTGLTAAGTLGAVGAASTPKRSKSKVTSENKLKKRKADDFLSFIDAQGPVYTGQRKMYKSSTRGRVRKYGTTKKRTYTKKTAVKRRSTKKRRVVKKRKTMSTQGQKSVVRKRTYGDVSGSGRIWLGASSMGRQDDFIYALSESLVMKMLSRIGDNRADKKKAPADLGFGEFFEYFRVIYAADGMDEAAPGGASGAAIPNNTIEALSGVLATELADQAESGRYPTQLAVFRSDSGGPARVIFVDQQFGSTKISFGAKGTFKYRNVTLAGSGAVTDSSNRLAVDSNSLTGKKYTFRNRVPVFKQPFLQQLAAGPAGPRAVLDDVQDTVTTEDGGLDFNKMNNAAALSVDQLNLPPLRPSTMFNNVSGNGTNMYVSPGGISTCKTSTMLECSLKQFLKKTVRSGHSGLQLGKVPPSGDCFLMCLRPNIKSFDAASTLIKIDYDYTSIYTCKATPAKAAKLPSTNFIEA